jgi:tetratricopeptide (TPR) repeat protein
MKDLISDRLLRLAGAGLFLSAVLVSAACTGTRTDAPPKGYEKKLEYYGAVVAKYPDHYPAHASLAEAYLEKARITSDPGDLAKAREQARRSIEIQPNYQAFKVFATIEGYAHHFNESIEWARKASSSAADVGPDQETASILVDGYLGLGENEEAKKVIDNIRDAGFYASAARGHYFKTIGDNERAEKEFADAARFALMQNAADAQSWAEVMAAGVWLDAGLPDKALPFLEKAEKIAPDSKAAAIHRAEYLVEKGRPEQALAVYGSLLKKSEDGEIHRRMFVLLRKAGRDKEADDHFAKAEMLFRKAIAAGEIYSLGPLAQMLCDAGVRLDEARKMSAENLKFKRDKEALKTEQCLTGGS